MSRYNYYEYFEKVMHCCKTEKDMMLDAIKNLDEVNLKEHIVAMHEVEHEADDLKREMMGHLSNDFMPAIEREDMLILSKYVDDMIDNIEDIVRYISIHNLKTLDEFMLGLIDCVSKSVDALGYILSDLKNLSSIESISKHIQEVGDIETEADEIFFNGMSDLYNKKEVDYYTAIARRTMYELIEKTVNSCEDVAYFIEVVRINNF